MSSGIMGSGDFAYRAQDGWAKWPDGWDSGDVAAVGVDRNDNVYAFNRGPHPMVVFDRDGNFLRSWGEGIFKNPHGVHIAPDDTIYLTNDGDHTATFMWVRSPMCRTRARSRIRPSRRGYGVCKNW